jgi:hypothetical protein
MIPPPHNQFARKLSTTEEHLEYYVAGRSASGESGSVPSFMSESFDSVL